MPQSKSFLRQFLSPWGWWAVGALVVAAFLLLLGQAGARKAERLTTEGADGTAEVIDLRRTTNRDSDGDIDYDYEVVYRFTADGETYEKRVNVGFDFYDRLDGGDLLPVRYWVKDPSVSEIELGSSSSQALFGTISAGIAGIVALVLSRFGWKRARSLQWMNRHGVRRVVKVTAIVDTNVKINGSPRYRATWTESTGRSGATRMARRESLPEAGSEISIMVDPDGRYDSIWEGNL